MDISADTIDAPLNDKTMLYANYTSDSLNRLKQEAFLDDVTTNYTYDSAGRVLSETQIIDEKNLTTSYTYDDNGRPQTKTYPNNFTIKYHYNDYNELSQITDTQNSNIWQRGERNARGQYKSSTLGNGIDISSTYDIWGNITNRTTKKNNNILDQRYYTYTGKNHLMTHRGNVPLLFLDNVFYQNENNWLENFTYDNENRLIGEIFYSDNTTLGDTLEYSSNGNLLYKNGVGYLYYNDNKPYQVENIAPSENQTEQEILNKFPNQYLTYTPFQRVKTIAQQYTTNALTEQSFFTYSSDMRRVKMLITQDSNHVRTKYYSGDYEEIESTYNISGNIYNTTTEVCYIRTPEGQQAAYKNMVVDSITNNHLTGIYYFATDHVGSITAVISTNGEVQQRYLYDAWGNRRTITSEVLPVNIEIYYPSSLEAGFPLFDRGYIGEEHLDKFGLINLNARLYDPILGRFLSPDPYVQSPDYLQNFNRYAYGLNNPLMYIDPDGEFLELIFGFLFFTDFGYDLQKTISPVAIKIDFRIGSNQGGIGIDVSLGVPDGLFPINQRSHFGATYFWKNTDLKGNNMSGWETRQGSEVSTNLLGFSVRYSGTTFDSKWSGRQTTNMITVGDPYVNIKYENDMAIAALDWTGVPKGDGDRYRTAAVQINIDPLHGFGTNLVTGDAGPDRLTEDIGWKRIDGHGTYIQNNGYDPNSHRNGIFYARVGSFRIGINSESVRKVFQNQFAHDVITNGKSKWFEVLSLKPKIYWQYGYSGGGTLW